MNDFELDDLLAGLAGRKAPDLPGSFGDDVLREIRLRKTSASESPPWLVGLLQSWLHPRCFALAIAAAVILGAVMPLAFTRSDTSMAIASLDLNVFSSSSLNTPSGLLAGTR